MVLTIKCSIDEGVELRGLIKRLRVYDDTYLPLKNDSVVYLPIRKLSKIQEKEILRTKAEIVSKNLRRNNRTRSFRRALQELLPKKVYETISRSYEQVGTIGIITINKVAEKYEKGIAKALLETNKGIFTVVKKSSHKGTLRRQKYTHLAGKKTTRTVHKESGVELVVDSVKTYFSARTFEERKRIASLVKPRENVLVMFSGIAPFPLVIAKNSKAEKIVGVELNKEAHNIALENVKRNTIKNVELLQGDIRKIVLKEKFDRIIMPHPSEADSFLDEAFSVANKEVVIHLYHFSKREKKDLVKKKILQSATRKGFNNISIISLEQQKISAVVYKYCYDIVAKKK